MNFADRLKQLPAVHHLSALQLLDEQGQVLATIENKPGQGGSLAVYHALGALYGGQITPAAATLSGMPSTRLMPMPTPASTPTSTAWCNWLGGPRAMRHSQ
jgi:hypothetical protein